MEFLLRREILEREEGEGRREKYTQMPTKLEWLRSPNIGLPRLIKYVKIRVIYYIKLIWNIECGND